MPSQTAEELIQEAKAVLDRCDRSGTFNRESEARVSQLLKMAELSRAGEIDSSNVFTPKSVRQFFQQTQMQITERTVDPAAIEFFAGKRRSRMNEGGTISLSGGRIEEIATGSRINGRPIGAIAELRDLSAMLPEQRSYRGLNTSTSDDAAGFTIPIGYIPQVIHAMKRTDQILEACNWNLAATADGRPINIPSLTDVETSAVPIAEAAAQTFQNVTFGRCNLTARQPGLRR